MKIYPEERKSLETNKEESKFNKFSSSQGLFLYRSVKIDSFTNQVLFDMISQDIDTILEIKKDFI